MIMQFALKYCFLILRNIYSPKKHVDSEFNSMSLKNHDGPCAEAIFRNCLQHRLHDLFQPTVFNVNFARITLEIDSPAPACY